MINLNVCVMFFFFFSDDYCWSFCWRAAWIVLDESNEALYKSVHSCRFCDLGHNCWSCYWLTPTFMSASNVVHAMLTTCHIPTFFAKGLGHIEGIYNVKVGDRTPCAATFFKKKLQNATKTWQIRWFRYLFLCNHHTCVRNLPSINFQYWRVCL